MDNGEDKNLKLNVKCFRGIESLDDEISIQNQSAILYAPNGTLKTSLARAIKYYSSQNSEKKSKKAKTPEKHEEIFLNCTHNGHPHVELFWKTPSSTEKIPPTNILVFESNEDVDHGTIDPLLLINHEKKKEYEKNAIQYLAIEDSLYSQIANKWISGKIKNPNSIRSFFKATVMDSEKGIVAFFERHQKEIEAMPDLKINVALDELLNEKVLTLLKDPDFNANIERIVFKKNELISTSKVFSNQKKFYYANAMAVKDGLTQQNYFTAGHGIKLYGQEDILDGVGLEEKINQEIELIFNDNDLKDLFKANEKKFTTKETRRFNEILSQYADITDWCKNLESYKTTIWKYILSQNLQLAKDLLSTFNDIKVKNNAILDESKNDISIWHEAIKEFHDTFIDLPFRIEIENKEDAILGRESARVVFAHRNVPVSSQDDLRKKLSTGESRAFYLLNIIFKIRQISQTHQSQDLLLVFDDIADSFDYKNKAAILNYLSNLSQLANNSELENQKESNVKKNNVHTLILTHNFDFYRSYLKKVNTGANRLGAYTHDSILKIAQISYSENPFKAIANSLEKKFELDKFVCMIAFTRNLIEFSNLKGICQERKSDYLTLTSCLHVKDDSTKLRYQNIKGILEKYLNIKIKDAAKPLSKSLHEEIHEALLNSETARGFDPFDLPKKLLFSVGIRILTEQKILDSVGYNRDKSLLENMLLEHAKPKKNNKAKSLQNTQTSELIRAFISANANLPPSTIRALNKVCMLVDENIHINTFMFEPLMDISLHYLQKHYQTMSALSLSEEPAILDNRKPATV